MSWLYALAFGVVLGVLGAYGVRRAVAACESANRADWGGKWLNRLDGLNRLFCRRYHRLRHRRVPLPARGPALVVANHVSGLDPLLMIAACRRPLRFIIAREQYERRWLTPLFRAIGCIPVERLANSRPALRAARRALEAGEVVALFPYGRIRLDHEPPARLKRGVLHLAAQTGAPIVPLRIDGVRGQGRTVSAVLMRSRARIRSHAPLRHPGRTPDALLDELAGALAPAAKSKTRRPPLKSRSTAPL
ncbi:glycerol acyltransferase [Sulfurifustis variabilis]|uniref:Glycerol acyltransferase n=1 Tax=Sulfurifustis variabilis TaxID=1675686 RepID=A0A1B4V5R7_9GAMM|nr:lysophospholipid acyltransferase family protein [Sulfurifustis variabilis]BAU48775.1 glycerol acyltransferase [Sulfurifustis variabilis]